MRIGIFAGGLNGRARRSPVPSRWPSRRPTTASPRCGCRRSSRLDALTTLAVVGHAVPGIQLGTAVVPTYPRHPIDAGAAGAHRPGGVRGAVHARHRPVAPDGHREDVRLLVREAAAAHARVPRRRSCRCCAARAASISGETVTAHGALDFAGAPRPDVLVAALGPKMLRAGRHRRRRHGHVDDRSGDARRAHRPHDHRGCRQAGRPSRGWSPGCPCASPTTPTVPGAAAKDFEVYGILPSYRAMLDREGAEGPADVAIIGDEAAVPRRHRPAPPGRRHRVRRGRVPPRRHRVAAHARAPQVAPVARGLVRNRP